MGCLALALSTLFYLRIRALKRLPGNLSANVFNKTFVVFNPYPEHNKIVHSLSFALPLIVFFLCMGFAFIVLKIFESGFMLSLFVVIISLNLIILEGALEVYQNSKTFFNAVQDGTDFGVGDIKAFQIVKNALPRVVKYYFGLSIVFIALSIVLPYVWSSVLWSFAGFASLIFQAGTSTGVANYQIAVFLFAIVLLIIQIIVSKIKSRLLSHIMESENS
jgi:small-conductance mechanosensitive channel